MDVVIIGFVEDGEGVGYVFEIFDIVDSGCGVVFFVVFEGFYEVFGVYGVVEVLVRYGSVDYIEGEDIRVFFEGFGCEVVFV